MLKLLKFATILGLISASGIIAACCAVALYFNPQLPPIDAIKDIKLQVPLRIYSAQGTLIGEYGEQFRTPVERKDIPDAMVQAFLAAEDDRFMEHNGIDIAGLLRAAGQLVTTGDIQSGGSTITMQVARNYFLSSEQTFVRKFKEILLAIKIERLLSKSDILELYVNKIYLGKRAYGVQAAAAIYYGSRIQDLNLAQMAMIAGLPKAPSAYNPVNNPSRALERRDWILGRMLKLNYIDTEEYSDAIATEITAKYYGPKLELDAGYAAEMARRFALDRYGSAAYTAGYSIYTTIDDKAQISAEKAVIKGLTDYTERHGYRGPQFRLANKPLEEQIQTLSKLSISQGLMPALITEINLVDTDVSNSNAAEENRFKIAVITNDRLAPEKTFAWNPKSNPIRKFISENRKGSPVNDIRQALQVGDIIHLRVTKTESDEPTYAIAQPPAASASLVALAPSNGAVQAIVGGFDYKQSHFNRAVQAHRQPGSNFKPFIYAAALENGFTAASTINDAPIVFADDNLEEEWRPENASGKFYGPTTLRKALYLSRNLVSVRLLRELGINRAIKYLAPYELGGGKLPRDLSLALGSHALTPIEVASLYAILANGGYKVEPYLVKEIRDRENNVVYKANPAVACKDCDPGLQMLTADSSPAEKKELDLDEAESIDELLAQTTDVAPPPRLAKRVMSEEVAFIIDDILRDAIKKGTGTKARALKRSDIAGKTGTTNGPTDAWFSGYHPELVVTTWLGFDNNEKLGRREYGGTAALPIWIDFMTSQLPGLAQANRRQPDGVVAIRIDTETGQRATAQTSNSQFEYFISDTLPPEIEQTIDSYQDDQSQELSEDLF